MQIAEHLVCDDTVICSICSPRLLFALRQSRCSSNIDSSKRTEVSSVENVLLSLLSCDNIQSLYSNKTYKSNRGRQNLHALPRPLALLTPALFNPPGSSTMLTVHILYSHIIMMFGSAKIKSKPRLKRSSCILFWRNSCYRLLYELVVASWKYFYSCINF